MEYIRKSVKTSVYGINNKGETVGLFFADGGGVHDFSDDLVKGDFSEIVDHPDAGGTTGAVFGVSTNAGTPGVGHAEECQVGQGRLSRRGRAAAGRASSFVLRRVDGVPADTGL